MNVKQTYSIMLQMCHSSARLKKNKKKTFILITFWIQKAQFADIVCLSVFTQLHLKKISPPGQGEVRWGSMRTGPGSRRSAVGVKEKCINYCRFSAEYYTFIWALKGPKIKRNMCLDLI